MSCIWSSILLISLLFPDVLVADMAVIPWTNWCRWLVNEQWDRDNRITYLGHPWQFHWALNLLALAVGEMEVGVMVGRKGLHISMFNIKWMMAWSCDPIAEFLLSPNTTHLCNTHLCFLCTSNICSVLNALFILRWVKKCCSKNSTDMYIHIPCYACFTLKTLVQWPNNSMIIFSIDFPLFQRIMLRHAGIDN